MKFFKKIFGKKEKPEKSHIPKDFELEERPLSPLLANTEQPVPLEKNIDLVNDEETIAPTLERQEIIAHYDIPIGNDIVVDKKEGEELSITSGSSVDEAKNKVIDFSEMAKKIYSEKKDIDKETIFTYIPEDKKKVKEIYDFAKGKLKKSKPKKQAKKKDNFNDDASKPKGRNFLI